MLYKSNIGFTGRKEHKFFEADIPFEMEKERVAEVTSALKERGIDIKITEVKATEVKETPKETTAKRTVKK